MASRSRQVTLSTSPTSQLRVNHSFEPPSSPPPSSPLPPIPLTPLYVRFGQDNSPNILTRKPLKQHSLPELGSIPNSSVTITQRPLASRALSPDNASFPISDDGQASKSSPVSAHNFQANVTVHGNSQLGSALPAILSIRQTASFTDDVLAALPSPSLFHRSDPVYPQSLSQPRLKSVPAHKATLVWRPASHGTDGARTKLKRSNRDRKRGRTDTNHLLARSALFIPDAAPDTRKEAFKRDLSLSMELEAKYRAFNRTGSIRTSKRHIAAHEIPPSIAPTTTKTYKVDAHPSDFDSAARSVTLSTPIGAHTPRPTKIAPLSQSRLPSPTPPLLPRPAAEATSLSDLDFNFPLPPAPFRHSQDLTSLPSLPDLDFDYNHFARATCPPPQLSPIPSSHNKSKFTIFTGLTKSIATVTSIHDRKTRRLTKVTKSDRPINHPNANRPIETLTQNRQLERFRTVPRHTTSNFVTITSTSTAADADTDANTHASAYDGCVPITSPASIPNRAFPGFARLHLCSSPANAHPNPRNNTAAEEDAEDQIPTADEQQQQQRNARIKRMACMALTALVVVGTAGGVLGGVIWKLVRVDGAQKHGRD